MAINSLFIENAASRDKKKWGCKAHFVVSECEPEYKGGENKRQEEKGS